MRESVFASDLIFDLQRMFPNCIILKNDPNFLQGFPDRLILFEDKWAALETKRHPSAIHQVNQDYYINILNKMSYASFINPENRERVLHELHKTFRLTR